MSTVNLSILSLFSLTIKLYLDFNTNLNFNKNEINGNRIN